MSTRKQTIANLFGLESDALTDLPGTDDQATVDPIVAATPPADDPAAASVATADDDVVPAEVYEEPISTTDGVDVGELPENPTAVPIPATGDGDGDADDGVVDMDAPVHEEPDGDEVECTTESWFQALESDLEGIEEGITGNEEAAAAAATDAAAIVGDPATEVDTTDIDAVSDPDEDEGVDVVLPTEEDTAIAAESILPDSDGSVDPTPDVVAHDTDAIGDPIAAVEEMPTEVEAVTDTVPGEDGEEVVVATAERWFVSLESDIADLAVGGTDINGDPTGQEPADPQPTETPVGDGAAATESVTDTLDRLGQSFKGTESTDAGALAFLNI